MTMQRHLKLYKLPEETKTKGLRQLKASDIPEACKLLNKVRSRSGLSSGF
jgi:glycylpeptide N-tetradecanoyltransferase